MRDYLFRGKTETGKWVYGNLIIANMADGSKYCCILEEDDGTNYNYPYLDADLGTIDGQATPVIPETVGQWTGMVDKNGTKIFEGDIIATRRDGVRIEKLRGYYGYDSDGYPQRVPGYEGESEYHYTCTYECYAEVKWSPCGMYYVKGANRAVNAICNEVVGNIHDNPELMKGE